MVVDSEADASPWIETSSDELRRLLTAAENNLSDFRQLAARRTARHLPVHAEPLTVAISRAVTLLPEK
ncbi:hypothetical protein ACVHNB_21785 [Streptomyces sp. YJ-C3]